MFLNDCQKITNVVTSFGKPTQSRLIVQLEERL